MPLIRAGEGHGEEVEKAIFFFQFCLSFPFSLKICEIKEQIGQGGNACKMEDSLGQEETEERREVDEILLPLRLGEGT